MNRDEAIKLILKHEGGYVNDPRDPGGETKFGIAKKFYPNEDIANLTEARAVEIYTKEYWNKCKCDELNIGVALYVFDTAVNQGVGFAIKMLQSVLGVTADGVIGVQTIKAANGVSASAILSDMSKIRVARYMNNKNFAIYGKGWLAREASTLKKAKSVC